jgi:hypothetical protein
METTGKTRSVALQTTIEGNNNDNDNAAMNSHRQPSTIMTTTEMVEESVVYDEVLDLAAAQQRQGIGFGICLFVCCCFFGCKSLVYIT